MSDKQIQHRHALSSTAPELMVHVVKVLSGFLPSSSPSQPLPLPTTPLTGSMTTTTCLPVSCNGVRRRIRGIQAADVPWPYEMPDSAQDRQQDEHACRCDVGPSEEWVFAPDPRDG